MSFFAIDLLNMLNLAKFRSYFGKTGVKPWAILNTKSLNIFKKWHLLKTEGWRKNMFYLTTHSTHFYLRLYGVDHKAKDHSDSERGNPLPPLNGVLFPISSKGYFIWAHPAERIPHTMAETVNSPLGPPWRIDPTTHRTMSDWSYLGATSRSNQCSTTGVTRPWCVLCCMWDDAYKRTLVANQKELLVVATDSFLTRYISGSLPNVRITVLKMCWVRR